MVKAARQRENTKEKRVISSKKAASNELLIRRSLVRVQQGEPEDQSFMDWSFFASGGFFLGEFSGSGGKPWEMG